MQLQFHKSQVTCLQTLTQQIQTQEQTQELRLPEGMSDIGRVLGAWGQVLLRSKEWRSGSMSVSGGVMAWALYEPEEGGYPQTVEAWIPFQMKWDVPETRHDGKIRCACLLRSVDARSTSARKLMLRANVSVLGQAFGPSEAAVYTPSEVPEDVQLLQTTYPMELAREAGEKSFELEEELTLPASAPKIVKLIRFSLQPELIDRRVMSDKVVFRGMSIVHILYRAEDGGLYNWDFEVPFSQYSELDTEYGPEATAGILPAVTSLELDMAEDGRLLLKGGMTCQYLIFDRMMLDVVEDAYSPLRQVSVVKEELDLPGVLESQSQTLHAEQSVQLEGQRAADVAFYPQFPQQLRGPDGVNMDLSGQFQLLYYDNEGRLQNVSPKWEDGVFIEGSENSRIESTLTPSGIPQAAFLGAEADLRADCLLDTVTTASRGIPMVTELELGELMEADPARPSLILRKLGKDSLWDLAKRCGSTVEKIKQANNLESDPATDAYLLIPVL